MPKGKPKKKVVKGNDVSRMSQKGGAQEITKSAIKTIILTNVRVFIFTYIFIF